MKKVSAILLILLMFITNINITLAAHYCGNKVVETSIVFNDDNIGCGMEEMEKKCNSPSSQPTAKSKNCCKTEFTQIGVENNLTIPKIQTNQVDFSFIIAFIEVFSQKNSFNASIKANYNAYSPPLLQLDIPILVQSFRI